MRRGPSRSPVVGSRAGARPEGPCQPSSLLSLCVMEAGKGVAPTRQACRVQSRCHSWALARSQPGQRGGSADPGAVGLRLAWWLAPCLGLSAPTGMGILVIPRPSLHSNLSELSLSGE